MPRWVVNIGIIALAALVVVAVPGGGTVADTVLAVISLAFLAAIAWFGARLYTEHRMTLWSLSTEHRVIFYAAFAVGFMTMVATPRLWESGAGTALWLALLAACGGALYYVWNESRRYRI